MKSKDVQGRYSVDESESNESDLPDRSDSGSATVFQTFTGSGGFQGQDGRKETGGTLHLLFQASK